MLIIHHFMCIWQKLSQQSHSIFTAAIFVSVYWYNLRKGV